jgi:hypothetical protein
VIRCIRLTREGKRLLIYVVRRRQAISFPHGWDVDERKAQGIEIELVHEINGLG